jgi:uncharacterized repeat protein (TIGR01451 family)
VGAEIPYLLPVENLPLGRQAIGLTVDVQAPPVVNLNQETRLKIVVRNSSANDALGVVVRDQLPEGLEFLDSQPPTQLAAGNILTWKLGTMQANSEKTLVVRVKPKQVGSFDHAATVIMMSGSKARTLVQEPKLKVEQTVKRSKALSGDQVEFDIFVSNPGTGPARDVVVQATLSAGLKHELGKRIEQPIVLIKPGERKELEPLIVEAVGGGDQSCEVIATSPDVPQATDEAHAIQVVTVIEPMLDVKIKGPATRFTDTVATYTVIVANPGTAVARDVRVKASLPAGGTLIPDTADAQYHRQYDRYRRYINWNIPQLEPKATVTLSFGVRLGGIQLYQVAAEAKADGHTPLYDKATCNTDVTGMADVVFQVTEPRRVLDEGEETTFEVRIRNQGTKEAARLLVRAQLSKNLIAAGTGGTDENAKLSADGLVVFPVIGRLATKGDIVLTIRVKGTKPGIGTCQVSLVHDDLDDSALFRTAAVRITAAPEPATR